MEGYSNFTLVALSAIGIRLEMDPVIWCKALSLGSALALLAVTSWVAPRGARGFLILLAITTCSAVAFWSAMGLETCLYALLLSTGWVLVARPDGRWGAGVLLLTLGSLTRLEGVAPLAAAVTVGFLRGTPRLRDLGTGVCSLAALVGYHAFRTVHFGAFLPTPILVKVLGSELGAAGITQLLRESPVWMPLVVLPLLAFRTPFRLLVRAAVPLVLQVAVLLSANGDWMGWARIVLPGAIATALALTADSTPRAWRRGTAPLLLTLILAAAMLEPRARADGGLSRRDPALWTRGLAPFTWSVDTPLQADLDWAVNHVPVGSTLVASDVGILGSIGGVRVRDSVGLVDRAVAEQRAGLRTPTESEWKAEYGTEPGKISVVRTVDWDGGEPYPFEGWWKDRFPVVDDVHEGRMWSRWYRTARTDPDSVDVARRWSELARVYPSLGFIRWHDLLVKVDAGLDLTQIDGTRLRTGSGPLASLPESVAFTQGTPRLEWVDDRGFRLVERGTLRSRPISAEDVRTGALVLEPLCEAPARVAVVLSAEPSCESKQPVEVVTGVEVPLSAFACAGTERVIIQQTVAGSREACEGGLLVNLTRR